MGVRMSATRASLLVVLLLAFGAMLASADISLDNTCTFGSDYIQLVGFACIAEDEKVRNPTWNGQWGDYGSYQVKAFTMLNKNINRVGIEVGGVTFCSNFTVRRPSFEGILKVAFLRQKKIIKKKALLPQGKARPGILAQAFTAMPFLILLLLSVPPPLHLSLTFSISSHHDANPISPWVSTFRGRFRNTFAPHPLSVSLSLSTSRAPSVPTLLFLHPARIAVASPQPPPQSAPLFLYLLTNFSN